VIEKLPSCDDVDEPELLPVDEARRRLFDALRVVTDVETVGLAKALNRVLANDVVSPMDVPAQANSAMDGYAIHSSSIPLNGETSLRLTGSAFAGKPFNNTLQSGDAVRIFTGAIMPDGADTVVIQEHVRINGEYIDIDSDVVAGKNVRQAGEDVSRSQTVLQRGRRLVASDIGVLASLGIAEVSVSRRLKVAFFTTGDELQSLEDHIPDSDLPAGMLFDSNRYTIAALLAGCAVEAIDMGVVADNIDATRKALTNAAEQADVVVTSGGVSAGDADFVTRAFHDLGKVSFWKLAMRPGRPLAFGYVNDAAFFGLPGNPVAVVVTFLQFVQPALKFLAGMNDLESVSIPAVCLSRLRKSAGRIEYQRGIMRVDEQGQLVVESTGKQGAGRLSSMSAANCLIVIDAAVGGVEPGDVVSVQPFHGLLPG